LCASLPAAAWSQVTRYIDVLPAANPALTDLNDAILYRGASSGAQAFDGKLDDSAYVVGPGDFFEINIWSPTARNYVLSVTPEGTLLVPAVGEIPLSGLNLAQARSTLEARVTKAFPRSEVSATLSEARRVRVYVSGLVKQPGTYELFAHQRLADAVSRAGEIVPERGSLRHVSRTLAGVTEEFDLLAFYAFADGSQNPYLVGGEQIRVAPREPREDQLQISGAVLSPGFVEFHAGDSVSDLLRFAFDFVPRADLDNIVVTRMANTGAPQTFKVSALRKDGGWTLTHDIALLRGDRIYVDYQPLHGRLATVAVYGEVERPGHYTVVEDSTKLSELVTAAGGLTPQASPLGARVLRPSFPTTIGRDSIPPVVSIDIRKLLSGDLSADVPLRGGDSIFVPPRALGVQVLGYVQRPGILAFLPDSTVDHYIAGAGGYTQQADKKGVRLVRMGSVLLEKPAASQPPLPGDQILVPGKGKGSTFGTVRNILAVVGVVAATYIIIDEASD
jgi:polysaccharide export outer membrane protein